MTAEYSPFTLERLVMNSYNMKYANESDNKF